MNCTTIYHNIRESAAFFKELGTNVLPIHRVDGKPTKGPRTTGWTKAAADGHSLDDFQDDDNGGVLLGGEKHLYDFDGDSEIARKLAAQRLSKLFPDLFRFGRKSTDYSSHYLFFGDKSLPSLSIKDPLDGKMQVELRCVKKDGTRGHQTVIPGSIHPVTGERIEFHPDSASTIPFAEAEELQYITRGVGALALIAKYFPAEGDRHKCILALARVFCQAGKPLEGALQFILLAYRYSRGYNHDLPKVEADIRSVYRTFEESPETHLYGLPTLVEIIPAVVVNKVLELLDIETPNTKPIEQPEQPEAAPSYSLDDIGNAQRFVQQNRGRVRYCLDEACWYVDDGRRWRKDNAQAIRELAKEIGPMIEAEANKLTSPVITGDEQADAQALRDSHLYKKALLKWANQTKCLKGMSNMLIVASSDPRIACYRSDFDKQPYLLNSWNGVIDLRTGKLLPHDPALMLSQLCPTEYHKDATHPMWNESLSAFTRKHPDVRDFLQRVFGYAIQSRKSEERIFDFRGDGGSGKGTLFTWIHATLGSDYCITMSPDSITAHKRNAAGPSSDLVRLAGKRIVIVSELEKHNKMQEGFLKAVSGGDRLVARGLNQSEIEIQPTYQFFIQTNYAPRFDAQDTGNQRRYLSVPFRNVLAQDPLVKFEKGLKARMSEDASFKQAVLAWAVKGSIDWHKNGLPICASVQEATKQLFKQNDFLGEFLEDCIQITKNPEDMVPIAQLRKSYEGWCQEQGEEPASGRVFNTMIEERGFRQKNTRNKTTGLKGRQWLGLRIKLPYDAPSRKTETFDKLREVVQ